MISRIILLITAGLVFATGLGIPVRFLLGDVAFLHCASALFLCLIPAVATLAWIHSALARDPRQAPLLALGASGVRMFGVLLIALFLHLQVPLFSEATFLFWVLGAYLYLLAVEVVLLVRGMDATRQGPTNNLNAPAPG